jgi:arabinogalactan oligomer/maltooligosaccharide transport system permease protein
MGLAHLTLFKDWLRGGLFALIELVFLATLPLSIKKIADMVTLGGATCPGGVEDCPAYDRTNGGYMLMDGVLVILLLIIFGFLYWISVRSAVKTGAAHQAGKIESPKAILNRAFPTISLAPAILLIVFFLVAPLLFAVLVAFTNYSDPNHIPPNRPINWSGMDNFAAMFTGSGWEEALGRVFLWTIIWAFISTLTCYFGGMLMAVILREANFKITPVFRAIFIIPYAIPGVVSLLVWRNLLNGAFGTVNRTLWALGIVEPGTVIPWLSDVWLAKFMCVLINLWVGFPYFMLLTTGAMTSISGDVLEAARIDGASGPKVFRYVTLPLVLYQTAPLMILSFASNLNNFGAIFFLTGGSPAVADTPTTTAGGTDIMISWIYKMSINLMQYGKASVLAIMIFMILAPFAIFNFRRTKSFKEGEL